MNEENTVVFLLIPSRVLNEEVPKEYEHDETIN